MTLREETITTKENAPFASTGSMIEFMNPIRNEIEHLTAEFLAKGGAIIDCSTGKATKECKTAQQKQMDDRRKKTKNALRSKLIVQTPIGFMDGKNRSIQAASSGMQNISSKVRADGRTAYRVVIGSKGYGVFYTAEEAIKVRDQQREILGMEKALY